MIEELRIKNFAIIDNLTVSLRKGFNVLTGETGAGKSIIVDAIGVLLREKISAVDFVKHGENESKLKLLTSDVDLKNLEIEDNTIILKKFSVFMAKQKHI